MAGLPCPALWARGRGFSALGAAATLARMEFTVRGKVWRYAGPGGWFFVSLAKKQAAQLRATPGIGKVAWGYIPVTARVGQTEWRTTLFPSRKDATYLIAIKADVRKREGIVAGDTVRVAVRVV